jgi:hypothetical protein
LLFLNENHQIVAQRTALLRPGQAAQFDKLLALMESLAGKQIPKPELLKVNTSYSKWWISRACNPLAAPVDQFEGFYRGGA